MVPLVLPWAFAVLQYSTTRVMEELEATVRRPLGAEEFDFAPVSMSIELDSDLVSESRQRERDGCVRSSSSGNINSKSNRII